MTKLFTKRLLGSTAALTFALSATLAYAQDVDMADPDKTHSEAAMNVAEETMEAAEKTMEPAEELEAAEPETGEWDKPMEIEADADTTMEMEIDPMTETVTVDCPEGTEVQEDGTCRIVADVTTENPED